ncbi:604_t:CDS:1, partial [Racocetra fulgida]
KSKSYLLPAIKLTTILTKFRKNYLNLKESCIKNYHVNNLINETKLQK